MTKFHFIFDKTFKANKLKKILLKKYKSFPPVSSNCIIVGGGDGFMLETIKKYIKFKKPFYGINCGSIGFLMNEYKNYNLIKSFKTAKKIILNPLQVINCNKKKKSILAINEISFFRQSRQTVSLKIKLNKKILIKKLIGDGVLISTPAGSTAYNYSAGGPVLSLKSGKLALTPISLFRPRRWKYTTFNNKSEFEIINLNSKKRPVALVADNVEIRNIQSAKIISNNNIKISLLHNAGKTLEQRIIKEKKNYFRK
jgi:NAD+ kinase